MFTLLFSKIISTSLFFHPDAEFEKKEKKKRKSFNMVILLTDWGLSGRFVSNSWIIDNGVIKISWFYGMFIITLFFFLL